MFEDIEINTNINKQHEHNKIDVNWMDFEKKFENKPENTKTFNFEDFEFFENKTSKQTNNANIKTDISANQNITSTQTNTFDFSKVNNNSKQTNNNVFDFFNNQKQTNTKQDQNIYDFFK
jgi:predicted DsbA family dithiol-disulfide isomerase